MTAMTEFNLMFACKRKIILVQTYEEARFLEELAYIVQARHINGYAWSITNGQTDQLTGDIVEKIYDPVTMIDRIMSAKTQGVYVLKDFHDIWDNKQAKRKLRDFIEQKDPVYKCIVITAPIFTIPPELEKSITVVPFELPNRQDIMDHLEASENKLRDHGYPVPSEREREAIIHALIGMTEFEIINILMKTISKHRKLVLSEIHAEKEMVIKKSGLLEYIPNNQSMDEIGGMDLLKEWLGDAFFAFDQAAASYQIDPARGIVLAGVPGCGKSAMAKSVANAWNLPLLKMNMSDIMDSKVGQSEKNIARALKLAESISPAVLWVDEFEKGISGK